MKSLKKLKASILKSFYVLTNGGYSVGKAYDCFFLLDWRHPIDKKLMVGLFENEILLSMIDWLGQNNPDLFLDIGSHSGIYSVIAKKNIPSCEVHAFEPDPENLCQLRANIFLNKFCENIKVHDFGLSNFSGETFFDRSENTGRGTRVVSESGNHKINVMKLDDVIQVSGKTSFLKIDVEGHEASVLDGAQKFLTNNSCFIQIEIFPDSAIAIKEKLGGLGYKECKAAKEFDYYFSNF